jgi:hypothetical protein
MLGESAASELPPKVPPASAGHVTHAPCSPLLLVATVGWQKTAPAGASLSAHARALAAAAAAAVVL